MNECAAKSKAIVVGPSLGAAGGLARMLGFDSYDAVLVSTSDLAVGRHVDGNQFCGLDLHWTHDWQNGPHSELAQELVTHATRGCECA